MIGVISNPAEHWVVGEFFELFKTPWEPYRGDRRYEVLLCAGDGEFQRDAAQLVLIYSGQKLGRDTEDGAESTARPNGCFLSYKGSRLPIYGKSITFRAGTGLLLEEESHRPAIHSEESSGMAVTRIGYDLFAEVRTLLTKGQPAANASIPALDLHIALLRDLIVARGLPLVEVPPVPEGYRFIACLTHDVDHPSIRRHKFDHTMFGFLYRALVGSLFGVFRGRLRWRELLTNWGAALKLPFVHLGLAKDFWHELDAYTMLEKGLRSTFFVIPFKDYPGQTGHGKAPSFRASRYGAADIACKIQELISAGHEIGLHGIDAWLDSSSGRRELEQIRQITGTQSAGVRMHWLYFDEQSPILLEKAGVEYDSTFGYNETVGYRAGTTQAYKPLEAARLLELPLQIMDTALFFPAYLGLSPEQARRRVRHIISHAVQFGGCVTVNWHDRSIAPERCWGQFYADLVEELKNSGAWFATAEETVSWFRKRRAVTFEDVTAEPETLQLKPAFHSDALPAVCLRIHNARESCLR
jgi:hypothetical protein